LKRKGKRSNNKKKGDTIRLSTRIRYGTRALLELARNYGKSPVNIKFIATKERISINYLEQLLSILSRHGVVKSQKGPGGGYYLAKPPKEIIFWDVFELLEGEPFLVKCLNSEKNPCALALDCVARTLWKRLAEQIKDFLKGITLQDIIDEEKKIGGAGSPPERSRKRRNRN
jgi:Rrf2 family protein